MKGQILFNLLFWIHNSFCTFHDYAKGRTPFLASPDSPSLIFYHWDFWTTFLLWKAILPWNFLTALKYLYYSEFLRNLCLLGKQSLSWIFSLYLIYFLRSGVSATFACPQKQSVPWIHCIECIFYPSEFWTTCACPENFPCIEIRIFEVALARKTEFSLKFFTVLNIVFTFRIFEQLVFAMKNIVCPEFTVLNIYFLSFRILNNLRLPWKT